MSNERGYWELASPLPDFPVGMKGCPIENNAYVFSGNLVFTFHEDVMQRNPAIFRWVPEPEVVPFTWPKPEAVKGYWMSGQQSVEVDTRAHIVGETHSTPIVRDAIRAVLQALREGDAIFRGRVGCVCSVIIRPDGSRP